MGSRDSETPLPSDILLFHILPRLPDKSIHRFLCVCKQWQSILTTPTFAKMHHHHHKLLIVLSTTTPCKFSTINLEAPQDGLTASRPLPFETSHENVRIVVSVRGLVCLRMINKCNGRIYYDIILWNPLTGEYKTVSRPNNEKCYVTVATLFGLYYIRNDYKLLLVTTDLEVYIYSLKSDSWRKVETPLEDSYHLSRHWTSYLCWRQPCVSLNEKMYFIVLKVLNHGKMTFLIIRFDLKTEKLREMAGPCFENDRYWKMCLSFMVVRGCIYLYVSYIPSYPTPFVTELWRMDGDDGDWTKVLTNYDPPKSYPPWCCLKPLHLMENGNWVMYDKVGYAIYQADLEKQTKKKVYSYYPEKMIIPLAGKYNEPLGSIQLIN